VVKTVFQVDLSELTAEQREWASPVHGPFRALPYGFHCTPVKNDKGKLTSFVLVGAGQVKPASLPPSLLLLPRKPRGK
jgi:hypothetical protein